MRTIAVATVGRSDYGLWRPILRAIDADRELKLMLVVSGAHLSDGGAGRIAADGFEVAERVEMLLASDSPEAAAKSMGLGLIGWAGLLARRRPDLLMVLGDRLEMHVAALAALPFQVPVAHVHGGEITQGAFDDSLRHSMTKLSHLHMVAHLSAARRVLQMGEEPWRVTVTGAPGIDEIHSTPRLGRSEFQARFGFVLPERFVLATFHPETLSPEGSGDACRAWLDALAGCGMDLLFTPPNSDPGHREIELMIAKFVLEHPRARLVEGWGQSGYYTAMTHATVMVGNSSSGLLEAPSFELPVVNIGGRQAGRLRAANVIDCEGRRSDILAAVLRAASPQFRNGLRGLSNPYGDGTAAARIIEVLRHTQLDGRLTRKRFHSLQLSDAVAEFAAVLPAARTA